MPTLYIDPTHRIDIFEDRFEIYSGPWRLFSFFVNSPTDTADKKELNEAVRLVTADATKAVWISESEVWSKKEYTLEIKDNAALFSVKLFGKGNPEQIYFFRGDLNGNGSRFEVAGYTVFNSQDNDAFGAKRLMKSDGGTLTTMRAAPPPFVFPFWNELNDDWTGIGIAAKKGEHNFDKFICRSPRDEWNINGCWFELPLLGYTEVNGEWESPYIWIGFGSDEIDVAKEYSRWQYDNLGFKKNIPAAQAPDWWKGPLFCGWGEQCALNNSCEGFRFSRQEVYEGFSERLDELGLEPSVIIIDDKWQTSYGTLIPDTQKWPDLRAFAEAEHTKGRHVVLWFKLWDAEGLPVDECMVYPDGTLRADPTNPKYIARLEKAVEHLLSDKEGCCNCDGFKLDFMDMHPRKRGTKIYEKGVFGLELQKRLFSAVYSIAKSVKPDALINMSSAHPYFAENCDQFRVHDFDPNLRIPLSILKFRSEFATAAMPDVLVDTDAGCGETKQHTLKYYTECSRYGVPCLYRFDSDFDESDWTAVRKAWQEYKEKI